MQLVMVLYVNGIKTNQEVDFDSYNSGLINNYELDPRYEWAKQNGMSLDHNNLLKLNIEEIPHEWKIETQSEHYQAVIRVYLSKYGELRARIWTMLDKSLLTVGIEEISFPHKNLLNFLFKIEEVYQLTRRT